MSSLIIGQFGINRCSVLDNFGKKSGGIGWVVSVTRLSHWSSAAVKRAADDQVGAIKGWRYGQPNVGPLS